MRGLQGTYFDLGTFHFTSNVSSLFLVIPEHIISVKLVGTFRGKKYVIIEGTNSTVPVCTWCIAVSGIWMRGQGHSHINQSLQAHFL